LTPCHFSLSHVCINFSLNFLSTSLLTKYQGAAASGALEIPETKGPVCRGRERGRERGYREGGREGEKK
jgi:hypothetical protein